MRQIRCHISTCHTSTSHKHKHDASLKQGPASLRNSLTGCGVFTVSMAVRQPLRPRFLAPRRVFPPLGPLAPPGALPPRLAATLTPTLALFLPGFAAPDPGTVGTLASDLAGDFADL